MKRRNKKLLSLLLAVLLLASMVVPASATNTEELSAASFTAAERAFFESQGIDFDKVVGISYEEASVSAMNENSRTRSATTDTVDVLQFNMVDGDVAATTTIMFLDDNIVPMNSSTVIDYGLVSNYPDPRNYITVSVEYRFYQDAMHSYVNPRQLSFITSATCTNLFLGYYATGHLYDMTSTPHSLVLSNQSAGMSCSYASVLTNTYYTITGSYTNGYSLPSGQAIQIIRGSSESHGVSGGYYVNGTYYHATFPFTSFG